MKFLLVPFLIIFITTSFAQQFKVTGVKNAIIENGKELGQNFKVPDTGRVIIKAEGYLYMVNYGGWTCGISEAGIFDLDSVFLISIKNQAVRDSFKFIIDSIFPDGFKGKARSICTTDYYGNVQDLSYKYGNIAFCNTKDRGYKIISESDTVTIRWRDPKYIGGKYFLVFKNVFDEIVEYRIYETNSY